MSIKKFLLDFRDETVFWDGLISRVTHRESHTHSFPDIKVQNRNENCAVIGKRRMQREARCGHQRALFFFYEREIIEKMRIKQYYF